MARTTLRRARLAAALLLAVGGAFALGATANGTASASTPVTRSLRLGHGARLGATSCGTRTQHVQHPTSTPLAGVWADVAALAPANASALQLGQEAVAAARHFGNTTVASNQSVQYVIASATQMHPDNF